ncbi:MACROD [Mytilus coruscus]|uniref:MACROD n=1 Tax=Mytilus coruscus TaxID=42192 RepID=A0A6J8D4A0_MYTCO|nr:MACROD [Mytilus coruscus]
MSGSITESEACASEFDESWTPQQGQLQENYNFIWEQPWKNLNITIRLANGTTSEHTSFLLVPIKMQFLMKHSLSKIHQIIHGTKCCQVDSINSSKEHLEIKVNSSPADEIFNEVENYLVNEVDEVLLKPIQRFPYTSKLAEEYFKKGLKERSIDMLRDDSKIYIVGHSEQKDYINKGIDEINRVTVTKILKMDEKWKIEAVKSFAFIEKLIGTFPDILARIQPGQSSIFLQGKDVTIEKAENEMKKLLSDLFNQNIQLDPLVLQLLTCKQASEMLTCILEKDRIQVVWTIDKTKLCFFSKFIINVDVLKSVVHEHFLTAGFSNSSQQSSKFCLSSTFLEITKMNEDKLLVLETAISGINIAATKQLILELLHREKIFYIDTRNTREVQGMYLFTLFDEVSSEIQKISFENKEIKRKAEGLELKCKKSEDRCKTLEMELHSEEEKFKRLAFEKHVLEETNRDMNFETTKQLKELRDLCYVQNSKSISQQNEIDSLKTTNEKLADNLKIVNDELRSQVIDKTKQEEKCKLKISNTDAAVNIKAKLNISASVFLVESNIRIKDLKQQSGVDVLNEDEGAITLVGDLRSISLALDILLQWTNETSDVKSAADKIGKNGQEKGDLPGSGNQTICAFLHKWKEDRNHEPNQMRDVERHNTRDPKSSSQKRALEVEGKGNNVPSASGGCQSPGHKMYPTLFSECGNMIDEQKMQPEEPISPSPDTLKNLTYFQIIDDDSLMMTTKERIKVYVYQGNLSYLNVQGIVNSSNEYMNHSSGLFSGIAKEAGKKMLDECRSYLADKSKLQQGKVCVTTAGNLKHYINVLHVCAPVWAKRRDTESYIEELMNVILNALISADDNKLRSVAFPAIGSGNLSY